MVASEIVLISQLGIGIRTYRVCISKYWPK